MSRDDREDGGRRRVDDDENRWMDEWRMKWGLDGLEADEDHGPQIAYRLVGSCYEDDWYSYSS